VQCIFEVALQFAVVNGHTSFAVDTKGFIARSLIEMTNNMKSMACCELLGWLPGRLTFGPLRRTFKGEMCDGATAMY
jgi:hypothetical protein